MTTHFQHWFRAFPSMPGCSSCPGGRPASTGTLPIWTALVGLMLAASSGSASEGTLPKPTRVFGGRTNQVSAVLTNPFPHTSSIDLRVRLYQKGGPLVALIDDVLGGRREHPPLAKTVESVLFRTPQVRAETSFLLQWLSGTNRLLSVTHLKAYPADMLKELRDLAGAGPVLVEDGSDLIRSTLAKTGVPTMERNGTNDTPSAALAIVVESAGPADLRGWVVSRMRSGRAIVWVPLVDPDDDGIAPALYVVPNGERALVVLDRSLLKEFASDPGAQLALIKACQLAVRPALPGLPDLALQFPPSKPSP